MHSQLYSLILVTVFAAFVLAIPTPSTSRIQKRSFKVHRRKNPDFKGYDGPTQLMKAYQKFGMTVPEGLHLSVGHRHRKGKNIGAGTGAGNGTAQTNGTAQAVAPQANGTGSVTATPVEPNDLEYIAPVTIGGQTLDMNFDTGSSDLWVFNTQLSAQSGQGHTLYDPTKSADFKLLQGATFDISYGDGSGAAGNVGTDTVDIGGATVTGQAIEMATDVSDSFIQDTNSNGLVGLAFSKINTVQPQKQKTFFDNAMPTLAEPVFTADLRQDAVGAYEFGKIDTTRFAGELTWAPIDSSNGFWEFTSTKFSVGNGKALNAIGGTAIADTGTTLMLVDAAIVNAYYSQVAGAVNNEQVGGITFPCDSVLPDLNVDVGGTYTATIEGKFINFAQVNDNTCFGGVQPTTGSLQIYGDIFFKSQFVVFNGGNNTLGLAPHAAGV
ncbi:hypothetical protein V500_01897 [Pseudogymnoascus sp. VKM F-4518 (FW-2643)]|nr:hypothetical protein V500_01897 [Pseudogymnoascus sp. VKM F-4518 (FW-2643)]